jgi:hypothetical protein
VDPDYEAWLDSLPVLSDAEEYAMAAAYAAEECKAFQTGEFDEVD